jgi:RNA polymerase sigma factor (sigma-70 family)
VAEIRRGHRFVTTRWSLVLAAGGDVGSADAQNALASLYEAYWYPLYAFLRGRGHNAHDAEDLTQAFFARLLEKPAMRYADPARGRFRSFLLTSLSNFAANAHDKDSALKRGGGVPPLPFEFDSAEDRFLREPVSDETPERLFDRRWALALLDRVLSTLDADAVRHGNEAQFQALKPYLTGDEPRQQYAEIGRCLGLSEGAIKVAVHRLRRQFRDRVREEIAETVTSPEEADDELRHLLRAVSR